ncbi:hypothetical protein H257_01514 [Aphanomyces astaci]|uniref:Uncharacterized protein n=1 Tax=Aphanomyces astaci TaxID=112090 RepID=W4HAS0_APHAT|nr:hypothetical protein H257_01514 [Aphanomyces astaci]ETV88208.1 hypothetical protein H257_01514 [Aphanomyces astaci]|eukprot:XP_009823071.1 hypothetical protein H257_01514 [Aphanomyces astaci]
MSMISQSSGISAVGRVDFFTSINLPSWKWNALPHKAFRSSMASLVDSLSFVAIAGDAAIGDEPVAASSSTWGCWPMDRRYRIIGADLRRTSSFSTNCFSISRSNTSCRRCSDVRRGVDDAAGEVSVGGNMLRISCLVRRIDGW